MPQLSDKLVEPSQASLRLEQAGLPLTKTNL